MRRTALGKAAAFPEYITVVLPLDSAPSACETTACMMTNPIFDQIIGVGDPPLPPGYPSPCVQKAQTKPRDDAVVCEAAMLGEVVLVSYTAPALPRPTPPPPTTPPSPLPPPPPSDHNAPEEPQVILDFSLTYNIVDDSAGDIADLPDAVESSWAQTLQMPKKVVTASLNNARRNVLAAQALEVSVEARLNEGDFGESKRQGTIDKSLVATLVGRSSSFNQATGLPADQTVTVESMKGAVSVTELPTLIQESESSGL